jgi:hypothetical protein
MVAAVAVGVFFGLGADRDGIVAAGSRAPKQVHSAAPVAIRRLVSTMSWCAGVMSMLWINLASRVGSPPMA